MRTLLLFGDSNTHGSMPAPHLGFSGRYGRDGRFTHLLVSRRMKHVYPRAMRLVESGQINLDVMISHRFPLEATPAAFAMNEAYRDNVIKVIIDVSQS